MTNLTQAPLIDVTDDNYIELRRQVEKITEDIEDLSFKLKCFLFFYFTCLIISIVTSLISWGMKY